MCEEAGLFFFFFFLKSFPGLLSRSNSKSEEKFKYEKKLTELMSDSKLLRQAHFTTEESEEICTSSIYGSNVQY